MRRLRANTQIKFSNMPLPQVFKGIVPDIRKSPTRVGKDRIVVYLKVDSTARTHTLLKYRDKLLTSTEYKGYVEELRWLILNEIKEKQDEREVIYGIRCRFFLPAGVKTGDIDNLTKPIMDAATGLVWHDDSQVWELNASLFRGWDETYSEFLIYSIMKQSSKVHSLCLFCGKPFEHWLGESRGKYCSFACYKAQVQQPKICDYCSKTFTSKRIRDYKHIFCSLECNYAYRREHPTEFKEFGGKFKVVEAAQRRQCPICKVLLSSQRALWNHMVKVHGVKPNEVPVGAE